MEKESRLVFVFKELLKRVAYTKGYVFIRHPAKRKKDEKSPNPSNHLVKEVGEKNLYIHCQAVRVNSKEESFVRGKSIIKFHTLLSPMGFFVHSSARRIPWPLKHTGAVDK